MKISRDSRSLQDIAPYLGMSYQLLIPILLGVFGGQALDDSYSTGSMWTIILSIAGIVIGMYSFIRQALKPAKKAPKDEGNE